MILLKRQWSHKHSLFSHILQSRDGHSMRPDVSQYLKLLPNNIDDNLMVSHYLLKKKRGKEGIAGVKADMSKAYDRVECDLLRAMLSKLGFRTR